MCNCSFQCQYFPKNILLCLEYTLRELLSTKSPCDACQHLHNSPSPRTLHSLSSPDFRTQYPAVMKRSGRYRDFQNISRQSISGQLRLGAALVCLLSTIEFPSATPHGLRRHFPGSTRDTERQLNGRYTNRQRERAGGKSVPVAVVV